MKIESANEQRITALDHAIAELQTSMNRRGISNESHIEWPSYANTLETLWTMRIELLAERMQRRA